MDIYFKQAWITGINKWKVLSCCYSAKLTSWQSKATARRGIPALSDSKSNGPAKEEIS